jgi:hypothetical protein
MICIFLYQTSIGPTAWVYTSEVLPPKGVGLKTMWNWGLTSLIAKMCPLLFATALGPGGVFVIFSGCTFVVFMCLHLFL